MYSINYAALALLHFSFLKSNSHVIHHHWQSNFTRTVLLGTAAKAALGFTASQQTGKERDCRQSQRARAGRRQARTRALMSLHCSDPPAALAGVLVSINVLCMMLFQSSFLPNSMIARPSSKHLANPKSPSSSCHLPLEPGMSPLRRPLRYPRKVPRPDLHLPRSLAPTA